MKPYLLKLQPFGGFFRAPCFYHDAPLPFYSGDLQDIVEAQSNCQYYRLNEQMMTLVSKGEKVEGWNGIPILPEELRVHPDWTFCCSQFFPWDSSGHERLFLVPELPVYFNGPLDVVRLDPEVTWQPSHICFERKNVCDIPEKRARLVYSFPFEFAPRIYARFRAEEIRSVWIQDGLLFAEFVLSPPNPAELGLFELAEENRWGLEMNAFFRKKGWSSLGLGDGISLFSRQDLLVWKKIAPLLADGWIPSQIVLSWLPKLNLEHEFHHFLRDNYSHQTGFRDFPLVKNLTLEKLLADPRFIQWLKEKEPALYQWGKAVHLAEVGGAWLSAAF